MAYGSYNKGTKIESSPVKNHKTYLNYQRSLPTPPLENEKESTRLFTILKNVLLKLKKKYGSAGRI